MVHSTQVTEETISNVVNKALNGPHNGSGAGESDDVVALNDVTVDMATEKDVAKMTSQECVASLGASMEEISQDKLPATSLDLEDHPIQLADNEWKPLDVGESNEVVFGQLVPYMHCVKLLHRVVLYMVYGIHPDLPQKYIDHLDMFMLSPCVHGRGWIQYSDFIDMIPMKILGMIMEKNAYKSRYEALGKTLYTSFEPLGVAHPVVRSAIITNDTVVSRIWSFAKILGSLGLMSFLRPEKLGERRRPPFVYVSETAAFYNTCIPLSDTVATPCSPDNFSVAQFTFSDMITVNQYWTALRETCIDSVKTELFQGIPVTSGIFSRKYRLFTNSSTVLDKLFIPKAVAVQQFTLPKFESFGVAGTEKKFDLQDPVHWYPMKKANTETRKLIKSQNMKNRVCKKSSLKLSKKLAEKAVAAAAAVKVNSRRRAAPSLIKRVPTGGRMAWKRGCEMTEKQNKINQEISNRKVTMRVVWSPEEDAVMIHAYVTTYTMRAFVKVNWGFGFFIRDILHELLPQLASTKNEFSINRRFRYLMNNDCKSMLQFFGLRFVASNSTQVLNFFKEAAIDSSMKEEQLWILFKKLYSCILKCNKNWPFVSPHWNMKYVKRNFNILRLFPTDATPLEWQFENEPGLEKWKASLCETILCMIMPYYFEKQYNPYSTPTVVLSKLLGVEHIASIMSTIFGRISSKILSENTKQIKTYPEYGRFLALMKLDRVPSGCMKMFHYWLSKHPLSKSFVSIYEESTVDTSALPELIGKQKAVQWDSWKDDAQTFLLFSAITDDSPYFKVNVEVSEPLFEFPAIKATAAMIEQESRKNRKRAQTEDESGSDHEDLIDQHPKLLNSIIQSNTTILDPPETFHDPQNISSQEDLEGLNLIKKDALLRSRQELNFRLAEYYRSFCAVTTQDKDQKICYHLPKMSLSLHSKLKQKVAEMGKTSQDNNSFLYDVLFQDALSDSTISSVFDLVKIQTPTDLELLPGVPFYMTVHSSTLDIRFDELSNAHRAVYASIHQRSHEGKLYNILRQELIHVSEDILLTILRDLILNGSVIVSGIKSIKFCAREFCPFFTSLRTNEVVVAHRIPLSSSFTTIKFLPSSFVNWDGSFCANFFSTVLNWVIETLSYLPTVNFTELHDRISIYLCPIQFLKVVKLAESLKMLEIREVAEECLTSHSFFENEEVKVNADLKHLFLYPTPDGLVRVKVFCQKFQLQRNLTYIGPQRLSLYASLIDLFKTRKLFDPYFLYYD